MVKKIVNLSYYTVHSTHYNYEAAFPLVDQHFRRVSAYTYVICLFLCIVIIFTLFAAVDMNQRKT